MALTRDKYIEVLRRHGRRVANRVALASVRSTERSLADFYACYAPEDTLPEHERCLTGFTAMFDPVGWFAYYTDNALDLWPEPPKQDSEP